MTAPVLTRTQSRVRDIRAMQDAAERHLTTLWRQYCRAAQDGDLTACDQLDRQIAQARIHATTLERITA